MRVSRIESKERTHRALLDAAAALFARRGSAASLEEITEAAGLTTGAVYSNFGSKRGLVAALFERMNDEQLRRIEVAVKPDLDLREALVAMARCWAEPDRVRLRTELRIELQVMLWTLDDPEMAPDLQANTRRLDERMTTLLVGRRTASGRRTTREEASRLLVHLRALVAYHAYSAALGRVSDDLLDASEQLALLVK